MTGTPASALLSMSSCISEAGARNWARIAWERGASREAIDLAWHLWHAERAREVQTIHTDPARCRCSHDAHIGPCGVRSCGCAIFRPKEATR